MAFLNEQPLYEEGIYQLEPTDPVAAGEGGVANVPPRQLANRTAWLKENVDALLDQIGKDIVKFVSNQRSWSTGEICSYAGNIWRCKTNIAPGPFSEGNWEPLIVGGAGSGLDADTIQGIDPDGLWLESNADGIYDLTGYTTFPNGFMLQWGTVTVSPGAAQLFLLPTTFALTTIGVVASGSGETPSGGIINARTSTLSDVEVGTQGAAAEEVTFFAWGI